MDDRDIERLLAGYRPCGPSPHLRAHVLDAAPVAHLWPWCAAAAVLLVTALSFGAAASRMTQRIAIPASEDLQQHEIAALTALFGGDAQASANAAATIARQEWFSRADLPAAEPGETR
jgi:hypothetical protein